jgi:hypothetical protein
MKSTARPIRRTFARIACILLFTALATQAEPRQKMRIEFVPPGQFKTLTAVTDAAHLGKTLRREGAVPTTSITVGIQDGTDEKTLTAILGTLFQAGFRRVLFAGPGKVEAVVSSATNRPGLSARSGTDLSGNNVRIPSARENQLRQKTRTK